MNHDDVIAQAQRWLTRQSQLRAEAERLGDIAAMAAADAEIIETQTLIAQLQAL